LCSLGVWLEALETFRNFDNSELMCLWHSWLKKYLHCSYKVSLSSFVTKDMHLTSSNDLYMRHPHLCIPSQVYIYPMLATHNNIVVFYWLCIYMYSYTNLSYNNTCSIRKYKPSFEFSATKSWTDMKYTSEGEKVLGEFNIQKHIWALCKKKIFLSECYPWLIWDITSNTTII
jgi:hypothetical protein